MYLFVSGFHDRLIANSKLTIWYILFAILSTVFFFICERIINGKTIMPTMSHKIHSQQMQQEIQCDNNIDSTKQKQQFVSAKYKDESHYNRLKRLCNPTNFIENYDKEKVETANSIYSLLMNIQANDTKSIEKLIKKMEQELDINFLDEYQFNELKNKLNPKNFMNPYDAQKVSLANELYSQILQPDLNYTKYSLLVEKSQSLIEYVEKKEQEENTKKEQEESTNIIIILLWIGLILFLIILFFKSICIN